MRHLMQNATGLVIVIIRTSSGVLWEVPVAVVWAWHNGVGARDGVEQRASIGAVAVDICAGDFGRRRLDAFDVGVDGADFGFLGGIYEPGSEIVSGGACSCVGVGGERDGICDACLEGTGLRGAAGAVGHRSLLDARGC